MAEWTVWRVPVQVDDSGEVLADREFCERCYLAEFGTAIRLAVGEIDVGYVEGGRVPYDGCFFTSEGSCGGALCREELHETMPTAWDRVLGDES